MFGRGHAYKKHRKTLALSQFNKEKFKNVKTIEVGDLAKMLVFSDNASVHIIHSIRLLPDDCPLEAPGG